MFQYITNKDKNYIKYWIDKNWISTTPLRNMDRNMICDIDWTHSMLAFIKLANQTLLLYPLSHFLIENILSHPAIAIYIHMAAHSMRSHDYDTRFRKGFLNHLLWINLAERDFKLSHVENSFTSHTNVISWRGCNSAWLDWACKEIIE